jgi:hypothetical protein
MTAEERFLVPPELRSDSTMTLWIYVMHERYVHDLERFIPTMTLAAQNSQQTAWGPPISPFDPVAHVSTQEKVVRNALVACPACYFPLQPEHHVCPYCGFWMSPDFKDAIVREAFEGAYFGWRYRKQFERDIALDTSEEDKVPPRHYFLAMPDDFSVWLAGAVAGGVLGNLAYDVLKIGVLTAWRQSRTALARVFSRPPTDALQQPDLELLNDEEKVVEFIRYCYEYYRGKSDEDSPIGKTFAWSVRNEIIRISKIENGIKLDQELSSEVIDAMVQNPEGHAQIFVNELSRRQNALYTMGQAIRPPEKALPRGVDVAAEPVGSVEGQWHSGTEHPLRTGEESRNEQHEPTAKGATQ